MNSQNLFFHVMALIFTTFMTATTAYADYIGSLLDQADSAYQAGNIDDAGSGYLTAYNRSSTTAEKVRALGGYIVVLRQRNQDGRARQYVETMLRIAPNNTWARQQKADLDQILSPTLPPVKQVERAMLPSPVNLSDVLYQARLQSSNFATFSGDMSSRSNGAGIIATCSGGGAMLLRLAGQDSSRKLQGYYYRDNRRTSVSLREIKNPSFHHSAIPWDISELPDECVSNSIRQSGEQASYQGDFIEISQLADGTLSTHQYGLMAHYSYGSEGPIALRQNTEGNKIRFGRWSSGELGIGNLKAAINLRNQGPFYNQADGQIAFNRNVTIRYCLSAHAQTVAALQPDILNSVAGMVAAGSSISNWELWQTCGDNMDVTIMHYGEVSSGKTEVPLIFSQIATPHQNALDQRVTMYEESRIGRGAIFNEPEGLAILFDADWVIRGAQGGMSCYVGLDTPSLVRALARLQSTELGVQEMRSMTQLVTIQEMLTGRCVLIVADLSAAREIITTAELNGKQLLFGATTPLAVSGTIAGEASWRAIENEMHREEVQLRAFHARAAEQASANEACLADKSCRCDRARSVAVDECSYAEDFLNRTQQSTGEAPHPLLVESTMRECKYARRIAQSICAASGN